MKKDPHYIASVEKAVAEKYGKQAILDFRSSWTPEQEKDYIEQLKKISYRSNNQKKYSLKQNRQCPVCKTYSFSGRDDLYMNRFDCCEQCYIEYVEFREERWVVDGWRPSHGKYKPPRLRSFIRAAKQYVGKILRRIKKWQAF